MVNLMTCIMMKIQTIPIMMTLNTQMTRMIMITIMKMKMNTMIMITTLTMTITTLQE